VSKLIYAHVKIQTISGGNSPDSHPRGGGDGMGEWEKGGDRTRGEERGMERKES